MNGWKKFCRKYAAIPVACAMASACSSQPELRITSNPMGAVVSEKGTSFRALTPTSLFYDLDQKSRNSNGCYVVRGIDIRWTSGVTVSSAERISLCGSSDAWVLHFERPEGPGIERDLAQAELRIRQITEAQARHEDAMGRILLQGLAGAAEGYAYGQSQSSNAPQYYPDTRIYCTPMPSIGNNPPSYTCR